MKRVSREEDYIEELSKLIGAEVAHDPDVVLPWDWWKQQAERFNVTPNNIYSRAQSKGLYIPPSKRTGREGSTKKAPTENRSPAPVSRVSPSDIPSSPRTSKSRGASGSTVSSSTPSTARALTERLQAMAEMADLLGDLESRINDLEREREREDARRRETLRTLDRLARVLDEAVGTVNALQKLYEE